MAVVPKALDLTADGRDDPRTQSWRGRGQEGAETADVRLQILP
jgi:hypothetical protein